MRQRSASIVAAVLIAALAFGVGVRVGSDRASPQILTGDGYVGDSVATFWVGDDAYGFRSSVPWTDVAGSRHDGGWPDCLTKTQAIKGIRFAGLAVFGSLNVVWVDCQSFTADLRH